MNCYAVTGVLNNSLEPSESRTWTICFIKNGLHSTLLHYTTPGELLQMMSVFTVEKKNS